MTPPPLPPEAQIAKARRRGMLAWWALLPFLAAVAGHIYFLYPTAKEKHGADYAMGLITGTVLGGLCISLLAGWIAYRLSSRSRLVATIVFSAALLLLGQTQWQKATHYQAADSGGDAAAQEPQLRRFATFGVEMAPPPRWREGSANKAGTMGIWYSPQSKTDDVRAIIMIHCEHAFSGGIAARAERFGKDWGATISTRSTTMGGEPALWVHRETPLKEIKPQDAVLAQHDQHLFLILGSAMRGNKGDSVDWEMEAMRKSWRWIAMEEPANHLELRETPLPLFNDVASVRAPVLTTLFDFPDSARFQGLSVGNIKANRADLQTTFELTDYEAGENFEKARIKLTAAIRTRHRMTGEVLWQPVAGSTQRLLSEMVPNGADSQIGWLLWGLIELDSKRYVVIHFVVLAPDSLDRIAYARLARQMCESVTLVK